MGKSDMVWVDVEKFKEEATAYLGQFGLAGLHAYGRKVGLRAATTLKMQEVILQIIAVLCGEQKPDPTRRGAPRKNDFIPPELIAGMDELIRVYLRGEAPILPPESTPTPAPAPVVKEEEQESEKPYYTITVRKANGETVLSLGTNLDFQIILSNQKPIASADMAKETDEENA